MKKTYYYEIVNYKVRVASTPNGMGDYHTLRAANIKEANEKLSSLKARNNIILEERFGARYPEDFNRF
jgi:hypothetical protein